MRVAMYYNNNDVRIEERQIPKINENEILVKVMACGICGSDVMEWYRVKKAPLVLGHEATGVIEKVGKNVKKYR
ncbi:MAG: alcohol dehydrogenase, partial [Euryarchaeota archaeon CG01_land_8_20_14_3_00_38_12]